MSSIKTDTRIRILKTTWKLLEQHPGKTISMSDVANAVGISRQAIYLHFDSRTELIVATSSYVDEIKGLNDRLKKLDADLSGTELLELSIEIWGNYIPEIYGLAKALLAGRHMDEAMATTWNGNMQCLYDICQKTIEVLIADGLLNSKLKRKEAVEMLWTMLSIHNWEQLTIECGWSTSQYITRMKTLLNSTFVEEAAGRNQGYRS